MPAKMAEVVEGKVQSENISTRLVLAGQTARSGEEIILQHRIGIPIVHHFRTVRGGL